MATDFANQLKVHYEFNETAANTAPGGKDIADLVGSNHLTDGGDGAYAQGEHGNVGQSYEITTGLSYPLRVALADMDWSIPTAGDFTISMWYRPPVSHSSFERIFDFANLDQSRGINLKMDSGSTTEVYFVINGTGYITSGSTIGLNTSAYNHIVIAHEHGVGLKLYINNSLSDTIAFASQILSPTTGGLTLLGEFASGSSNVQYGRMAQCSIWNRLLDANDVEAHHNNGDGVAFASYGAASPRARASIRYRFSTLR